MSNTAIVEHLPDCDFCGTGKKATYDGATIQGPWANMCATHFRLYGIGLGTGKGQQLVERDKRRDE